MSSRSEHASLAYVIVGEARDSGIDALIAQLGTAVIQVPITGAPGDGRRLLEIMATCDRVVFSGSGADSGSG